MTIGHEEVPKVGESQSSLNCTEKKHWLGLCLIGYGKGKSILEFPPFCNLPVLSRDHRITKTFNQS